MKPRHLSLCLLMTILIVVPLRSADSAQNAHSAKEKAIRQLIELTGTSKLMKQIKVQLFTAMQKNSGSQLPTSFWNRMDAKFKTDELIDKIVQIYDRYFTKQDIDGLIVFYQSPLGRKVISTLPLVTRDSMAAGQQWGMQKATEVQQEMAKEQQHPHN